MPMPIQPPPPPPTATQIKIADFHVHAAEGWVRATLIYLDENGAEVSRQNFQSALYDPQGAARFPVELYAACRDALYTLAIQDGYLIPADVP